MKNKTFKRLLSLVIAAGITAAAIPSAFASELAGDVNSDGKINSADALLVLKYSVGISDSIDEKAADLNGDGKINSADALEILKISVGITPVEPEKKPLDYNKAELVDYYNTALKNAYSADKITINKNTDISIKIEELSMERLLSIANSLIKKFATPTSEKKSFSNGVASDKTTVEKFLVPTALEADGAKDAVITQTENGYKVVITLVEEKVNQKTAPKYNTQASLPLVIDEKAIKDDYNATITSASLDYTGTVLTAEIDNDGNILSLNHTMPLKISGSGKYLLSTVSGSGSGTYTLNATFSY